jgi:transcriptional regulator with XRE-family HTH domain
LDPQTPPEDLRLVVRLLRGLHDWSQKDLAAASSLSASAISRYESGRMVPTRKALERLASAAGVPMSALDTHLLPALKAVRLAMAAPEEVDGDPHTEVEKFASALSEAARTAVTAFLAIPEAPEPEP